MNSRKRWAASASPIRETPRQGPCACWMRALLLRGSSIFSVTTCWRAGERPSCGDYDGVAPARLESNDALDHIDPSVHGREQGQVDGTPEDGDSFFDIVE